MASSVLCENMLATAVEVAPRNDAENHRLQLAALVEAAWDAMIGTTTDGVVISWNRAAELLFGYAAEEVIGGSISVLQPRELHHAPLDLAGSLGRGESIEPCETVLVRADGQPVDVRLAMSPVYDSPGHIGGGAIVARDSTARKRGEAALRASKDRLRIVREQAEQERANLYRVLLERDTQLHEAVGEILIARSANQGWPGERDESARLTRREHDVLNGVAMGQTNAQIARALGLGPGTVKNHVEHVLKKLGLKSRTQAAVWAARPSPAPSRPDVHSSPK